MTSIQDYVAVTGENVIDRLRQLARPLRGTKVVHVNSTYVGGGVAEILSKLVPLQKDLGLDVRWEVIRGEEAFFQVTKTFHNALQGIPVQLGEGLSGLRETGAQNSKSSVRSLRKPT
jgi:trehalose synthase